MPNQFKFTSTKLKQLPPTPHSSRSTETEYSDTEAPGLKLLVGKTGNKRFLFRYTFNKAKRSISLGRYPDVSINTAREQARAHRQCLNEGYDPREKRVTAFPTIQQFFYDTYLPLAKKKKRTWNDDEARFRLHCSSIADLPYDELTPRHLLAIQMEMSTPTETHEAYAIATCNRVVAMLKTVGKLAEQLMDIPNVATKVSLLPCNNPRHRYCTLDETQRIINAALAYPNKVAGSFIALLFLTGCRLDELRVRQWVDIDWDLKELYIERTKNGSPHKVYLNETMLDILLSLPRYPQCPYIFAGRYHDGPISRPKVAFDYIKRSAFIERPDEVVFHSARHSLATNLIANGTDVTQVQRLLNHKSLQTTQRYVKLDEAAQRRSTQKLTDLIFQSNAS